MSSVAWLALEKPAEVPAAAVAALLVVAEELAQPTTIYTSMIGRGSSICEVAAWALERGLSGEAGAEDLAALVNAERVLAAMAVLVAEHAVRSERRERVEAVVLSRALRNAHAVLALTRREFIPLVFRVLSQEDASQTARVRVLPGAEEALMTLERDALLEASTWELTWLADQLTRWVAVS